MDGFKGKKAHLFPRRLQHVEDSNGVTAAATEAADAHGPHRLPAERDGGDEQRHVLHLQDMENINVLDEASDIADTSAPNTSCPRQPLRPASARVGSSLSAPVAACS